MPNALNFAEHPQWMEVGRVLSRLMSHGYLAYVAGGAVRDGILGREPKDFDIATDASEEKLQSLFPEALPVGQQFGIFILPYEGFQIEVAGFRREGEYLDGRRPSYVEPGTAQEDAQRRDFTVNALFYDPSKDVIIDYVNGQSDLKLKLLRCVGDPVVRFEEDHLRLLRACRFVAQLGFSLEEATQRALAAKVDLILKVSPERTTQEWLRLLGEDFASDGLHLAIDVKLAEVLFPKLNWDKVRLLRRFEQRDRRFSGEPFLLALMLIDQVLQLFESGLLSLPEFKNKVHSWLKPLRLSNQVFSELVHGLYLYCESLNLKQRRRGEQLLIITQNRNASEWLKFWIGQLPKEKAAPMKDLIGVISELENQKALLPWLTGKDLMQLGHPPGVQLGRMLKESHILQLEGQLKSRDQALEWAKRQKD